MSTRSRRMAFAGLTLVLAGGSFYGGLTVGARHPAYADPAHWPKLFAAADQPAPPAAPTPPTHAELLKQLAAQRSQLEARRAALSERIRQDEIVLNVLRSRGETEESPDYDGVLRRQENARANLKSAVDAIEDARRLEAELRAVQDSRPNDVAPELPARVRTDVRAWILKNRLDKGEDPFDPEPLPVRPVRGR